MNNLFGELSGQQAGMIGLVFVLAIGLGVGYDQFVAYLHKNKLDAGYTAILVAAGVVATLLLCLPFIGLYSSAIVLFMFIGTGTPMLAGDIWRYMKQRQAEKRQAAQTIKDLVDYDHTP